ncbi:MAG: serine/threonine-protein kinase [Planctomycetota bacterium]|nr:serine/threonine-protein kinase [Planctomycetota bacterium]
MSEPSKKQTDYDSRREAAGLGPEDLGRLSLEKGLFRLDFVEKSEGAVQELRIAELAVELGFVSEETLRSCLPAGKGVLEDLLEKGLLSESHLNRLFLTMLERGLVSVKESATSVSPDASPGRGRTTPGVPPGAPQATAEAGFDDPSGAHEGEHFGKFVMRGRIASGGMGSVWKAYDPVLGRDVAIKFLRGENRAELERFIGEAKIGASLAHPNICAIYEAGEIDGRYFIAMQYVDGASLDAAKIPLERKLAALKEVAIAMDWAHNMGVIHRDLKPQNIMIDNNGKVFVTDFGIARRADSSTETKPGSVLGTPYFMAPEQARGEKADHRADVYALGATLYYITTGKYPFEGRSPVQIIDGILSREPVAPRAVDASIAKELETITLKAMSKEPAARYETAAEFGRDLGRFLAGEPILGRRAGLLQRACWRIRKRPLFSAALLVLVPAAAIGGFLAISEYVEKGRQARLQTALAAIDSAVLKVEQWDANYKARNVDFARAFAELDRLGDEVRSVMTESDGAVEADYCLAVIAHRKFELPRALGHIDAAIVKSEGPRTETDREYAEPGVFRLERARILLDLAAVRARAGVLGASAPAGDVEKLRSTAFTDLRLAESRGLGEENGRICVPLRLFAQGKHAAALAQCEAVLIDPAATSRPELFRLLAGDCAIALGRIDAALAHFEAVVDGAPSLYHAYVAIGWAHYLKACEVIAGSESPEEEYALSIDSLEKALDLHEGYGDAHLALGVVATKKAEHLRGLGVDAEYEAKRGAESLERACALLADSLDAGALAELRRRCAGETPGTER